MLCKGIILHAFLCFSICDCANILGIIPACSFSHQIAFINLWKELVKSGHQVTVLTTNPQNDTTLPNLKEIDLSIGYKLIEEKHGWSKELYKLKPLTFINLMLKLMYELTDLYLSLPEVQNLIHNKGFKFDVVMVESVFPEWLIFGEVFNAPTIMVSSMDAAITLHKLFDNPVHPVIYPETYIPYTGKLAFHERLISTVLFWTFDYIKNNNYVMRQNHLQKYFNNYSISIEELIDKSSMLFVQVSPVLLIPRPLSPRTINIGGGSTISKPQMLPQEIQEFLDSAKQGAIYFSLGSNAKSEHLGEESVKNIIEAFRQLPYKVLWKFTNESGYEISDNVKTVNWVPQQDVLRHPNMRLFVTQGGIQSLEEAIHFEMPLVGIPIFGDQESNIKRLNSKGVLKMVSHKPKIDALLLKEAIMEVITNNSYKENMKKFKILSMDQPMSGLEKAVWWTEYVIRHKGELDHLKHEYSREMPFYQYYLLDVYAFLVTLFLLVIGLIYVILRFLIRLVFRYVNRNNIKEKKNI